VLDAVFFRPRLLPLFGLILKLRRRKYDVGVENVSETYQLGTGKGIWFFKDVNNFRSELSD